MEDLHKFLQAVKSWLYDTVKIKFQDYNIINLSLEVVNQQLYKDNILKLKLNYFRLWTFLHL